jgi:hypothetical protein
VTPETNTAPKRSTLTVETGDTPTAEQFLLLAQKVEELEDRVRSLAVNDIDRLRATVQANQASIRNLKSPRYWIRGFWRRLRPVGSDD